MVKKAPKTKEKKKQEAKVINNLENIATKVHSDFKKVRIPNYGIPTRTKSNIVFHEKKRVWKYGDSETVRSAKTLDGAYTLLRTMFTIDFVKEMIKVNKSSTLREMYYISEGWGMAKFHAQNESDKLIEDLEIVTRDMREDFKLRPEEDGARVIGDLTIEETVRSGKKRIINTKEDVGDAGYTIPYNVEMDRLRFKKNKCKFLVAIETGGMFDRLVENGFDEEHKAMLVHLKGQPARSTRRFIKRLNEEMNLPVICFTDGDPWSFRIFASVAYGAIKTAHISEYLATPTTEYLGVTASDIVNYELPSDKLNDQDIRALKAELSDPRFNTSFWKNEIKLMLDIGKKSEQQSLAKYGLDFVTDTYLPEKLEQMGLN